MTLSDLEIAELADHEAVPLGLPRRIEAWVVMRAVGRIESPDFTATLSVEPQQYAHPWIHYHREGAILSVGDHQWRITPQQLKVFKAFEQLQAAGDNVETRLRAWPELLKSLHGVRGGQVRVEGELTHVVLKQVAQFPPRSKTYGHGKLILAEKVPQASWAMGAGHRYYLKTA